MCCGFSIESTSLAAFAETSALSCLAGDCLGSFCTQVLRGFKIADSFQVNPICYLGYHSSQ